MIFGSLSFWIILLCCLVLFYLFPNRHKWTVLLTGSMIYLGTLSLSFLIYATIYAFANFFFGKTISNQNNEKKRRQLYLLFLVINITQLVVFKYINFIIENLNVFVNAINSNNIPYVNILVPVGISYYTFQCIGYIINIYRKQEIPEKHFGNFLLYNLFFSKVLSGPIERSDKFLPQIHNFKSFDAELFKQGLSYIMLGLFKKLIIAERLAVIVNNVYKDVGAFDGFPLLLTMFLQAIYVYSDFSGYTDMALGIAQLFGIKLTDNFKRPFFSSTVSDFWRRWHISLSSWCNHYIFNTIIFKRRRWGKKASVYGVFITFLIIGIWHGPNWTYVILGILHGCAINYEYFSKNLRNKFWSFFSSAISNILSKLITFTFCCFALIFFFAHTTKDALLFIKNMFVFSDFKILGNNLGLDHSNVIIVLISIFLLFIKEVFEEKGFVLNDNLNKLPKFFRWSIYYIVIFLIIIYGKFVTTNFIYFQF